MPEINRSVGRNAVNDEADVTQVQRLLNAVAIAAGGADSILDIDGWCGPGTIAAISRFQSAQLKGFSDGNVSPGLSTIALLNAKATAPGARPVPLPDPDPAAQARQDAPQALVWGTSGLQAITAVIGQVQKTGAVAGFDPIVEKALIGHFGITPPIPKAETLRLLSIIQTNFTAALIELAGGPHFRSVGRRRMRDDLAFNHPPIKEAPGYTFSTAPRGICWSPLFHSRRGPKPGYDWAGLGFGPKCRAAMVLHEPIHFVDPRADFDVYEWGPDYVVLAADRAVHNASSYPSFAAHVAERSTLPLGPRYGVGRPLD